MAILRSLIVSLLARTDNFEQGMRKAEGSLRGFRGATVQFQGQIRGLTTELLKFSAAQAGIATALDAARKVIQTGLSLEQVKQGLLNVTGSAAAARQALLQLEGLARETGVSFLTLANGFTAMQQAARGTTLSFTDITRIFEQFMRLAGAAGIPAEGVATVLQELTEIVNKQTLSLRDFTTLLKFFPGLLDAAATAMGRSRAEFAQMASDGELLTTVVLPRLAEQLSQMTAQNVKPLTTEVEALTTAWDELWRAIAESGVLTAVTRGIQEITQAVKDLEGWVKKSMSTWEGWNKVLSSGVLGALLKARFGLLGELLTPGTAEAPGTGGLAPGQPRPGDTVPNPEERTYGPAAPGEPGAPGAPGAPTVNTALEREIQRLQEEIDRRYQAMTALTKRAKERMLQFPQSMQTIVEETAAAAETLIQEAQALAQQLERSLLELEQQGQKLQAQAGKTAAAISPQRAAIRQVIERLAPAYGLDPRLVEAMVKVESNFNPRAVSPKGAQGLMQLMPPIQKHYGVTDPFDIEQNLNAGMQLLSALMKQFHGDVAKALTAYHSGPQAAISGRLGPQGRAYPPAVQAELARLQASGTDAMDTTAAATNTALDRLEALRKQVAETRKELEAMRATAAANQVTLERLAAEDRYIDLLIETDNQVKALTLSEEELARTSLDRMREQAAMARELRDAMRKDPAGTTARVEERLAAQLEERQRLQATDTLDTMRLQQQQGINEVIGSLREQEAQLTRSSKGYLEYRLAVLGATEAEIKEASSLQQMLTVMEQVKDIGQTVFDNLAESLSTFVATGKMDFKSLADAIIADLARIALRATITEWGQKLLNLGLNALGGGSTPSPAVATMDSLGSVPFGRRQLGGPVLPQRAYLVGEAGPELFIPGRSGTVMANRSLQGGEHTTVNLHFPGVTNRQEADAIRRSAGQIGSQMIAALERTRARNHVPNTAR